jgi:hypothetical protein
MRCAVLGTGAGFVTAVAAGLAVALAYLCLTLVVYRWIIPLQEPPGAAVLVGLPFAAVAAAIGFALGRRSSRSSRSSWPALMAAVAVAVLGALIAPLTVQRGAEVSFEVFPPGGISSLAGGPEDVTLPAAGRWGIYGIGSAPANPDCLVTAVGKTARPADRIPIPPARPGADTVPTYRWVAQFDISAPGAYSVTCQPRAAYIVNRPPTIRGAVGALVHWPVPAIWLLGALPGVLVIVDILIRRTRRGRSDRAEPGVGASPVDQG